MGAIVGIDLGTSTTVVAHAKDGKAETIADPEGVVLIPSVVSFLPNGNVIVGYPARDRRYLDPQNTIFAAKRLVGRAAGWIERQQRSADAAVRHGRPRATSETIDKLRARGKG